MMDDLDARATMVRYIWPHHEHGGQEETWKMTVVDKVHPVSTLKQNLPRLLILNKKKELGQYSTKA
jgi:hypothetical protein